MLPIRISIFLALLLAAAPGRAVEPEQAAQRSLEALYGLEYERALAELGGWVESRPADPLAYLSDAGALWWWEATEPGMFKRDKVLKARFKKDLETAMGLVKANLGSGNAAQQAEALFVTGLSLGIRAQWNLNRGRWLKAYFDGKGGKKYLLRCLSLDPGFYDAHLGIGLFDYLAARLPGVLKIGAWFISGDAESGKEALRLAMTKGRYRFAATQSASNLMGLYILYEAAPADAMKILRGLLEEFPESPYFRFVEIVLLQQTGDLESSRQKARVLFQQLAARPEIMKRRRMAILCGVAPADCLKNNALVETGEWLTREIEAPAGKPAGWTPWLHLHRGLVYDILKRRPEAIADYKAVSGGDIPEEELAMAARCIKKRCGRRIVQKFLNGTT